MRLKPSLLLPALALPLGAGTAPAIPPEVWAMKSDPAQVAKGAVFLEDRLVLSNFGVERFLRIRILHEKGKAAAELPAFGESLRSLEGRTIHPDGRIVEFNSRKDFQTKTVLETQAGSVERHLVVPPGVSDDCVVEVRWMEAYDFAQASLQYLGRMKEWQLTEAFPVATYVVEVPKLFVWGWSVLPSAGADMARSEAHGRQVFTFRNVPAFEEVPYSLTPVRSASRLVAHPPDAELSYASRQGEQVYWEEFTHRFVRPFFDQQVTGGETFDAFAADLVKGLPESPTAAAGELLSRLDGRIRNLDHPTFQELAQADAKSRTEEIDPHDLDATVKRGRTTGMGMVLMYFHLLRRAGIQPSLAFVADRNVRVLNPRLLNYQQLMDVLVGVGQEGKGTLWLDPTLRFAGPGVYSPAYQGVPALVVETGKKEWTHRFQALPPQAAAFHQRRYTYRLELGEEEDRFHLEARFTGYPEFQERRRYVALEPKDQARRLKESLEQVSRQVVIGSAEVREALNLKENLGWVVDGSLEREGGHRRTVDPFPLMAFPLWIPSKLDEARQEQIVLPYLSVQLAVSTFTVPKGRRVQGLVPYKQENAFGRVVWTAESTEAQGATTVKVVFRVDLNRLAAPAAEYPAFKEFLGWVREAMGRQLVLETL